jgi:hypothetical protein
VAHLRNHWAYVVETIHHNKIDVLIIPETQAYSVEDIAAMAKHANLTFFHVARTKNLADVKRRRSAPISRRPRQPKPRDAAPLHNNNNNNKSKPHDRPRPAAAAQSFSPVGGGVGILVRQGLDVERGEFCEKGGLSVYGESPGGSRFAVIGLYLPPASSRRCAWREPILQWAGSLYDRLDQTFDLVVIGGDLNFHYLRGPNNDRHVAPDVVKALSLLRHQDLSDSDEEWRPRASARGRGGRSRRQQAATTIPADTRRLHSLCAERDIRPTAGVFATRPAETTSRSGANSEHKAESDYLLANTNKLFFWPLLPAPWDEAIAEGPGTHRLVACKFALPPPRQKKALPPPLLAALRAASS